MTFTIEIDCDNAAFANEPASEVARILREAAEKVADGHHDFTLRDVNGNTEGRAKMVA